MLNRLPLLFLLLLLLPTVSASIFDDIHTVQTKVDTFITDAENTYVVEGMYASFFEKKSFEYISDLFPDIALAKTVHESEMHLEHLSGESLILLGGPKQNLLAAQLLADEAYTHEEHDLTVGRVVFLDSPTQKVIIFSDPAGFTNNPNTAAANSPLAKIMPVEYVPLAATGIGLSLLVLWKFIASLFIKVARYVAAAQILKRVRKKRKKQSKHAYGTTLFGVRIKYREWFAVTVAAIVFAVSLSYVYLAPDTHILQFLAITCIVNFIIYAIRHGARLLLDREHKLHTEYVLWYFGAVITAITGWLGTTFALAGFVEKQDNKDHTVIEGRIAFAVNFVTFLVFLFLAVWNFLKPNVLTQMAMLLSLSITYLQMLPFDPFAGKTIYRWRTAYWWPFFIVLTVFYIGVMIL